MVSAPLVSIIIPSAADPSLLRACLESLEKNGPHAVPYETIIVLNRLSDHAEALESSSIPTTVITSPVNLGLAGATNRARTRASGEFLIVLHDDSEIEAGWMEALIDCAREHPEAGAIGGMVLYRDGRLQSAGMILWRDGSASAPWIGPPPPVERFRSGRRADFIGTSSLLIRAATFDAVGGFDEEFYPVYSVDIDFSMRVRKHGQIVWYEPRSRTRHWMGGSGKPRWKRFLKQRNRALLVRKWERDLQAHEPRVDDSPEAIDRAIARAQKTAVTTDSEASHAFRVDFEEQERRHLLMDAAVQREFATSLTAELDAAELVLERHGLRRPSDSDDEIARLRARDERLTQIESSRMWSLYTAARRFRTLRSD